MKIIRVALVIAFITVILLVSLVSALDQNEASVNVFIAEGSKVPGQIVGIRILFTNNGDKDLTIYNVGIHLDWMDTDELYGLDYSSYSEIVAPGDDFIVDIINFTVPFGTSGGNHSYYIGVDGYDEDDEAFSWTSADYTLHVATSASSPTATPTTTNGNGQTTDNSWVTYLVIIAVAAALAVLIVIIIMKRRTTPHAVTESSADQSQSSAPSKPDEEQDFNI